MALTAVRDFMDFPFRDGAKAQPPPKWEDNATVKVGFSGNAAVLR
jgi:hypothetical protein